VKDIGVGGPKIRTRLRVGRNRLVVPVPVEDVCGCVSTEIYKRLGPSDNAFMEAAVAFVMSERRSVAKAKRVSRTHNTDWSRLFDRASALKKTAAGCLNAARYMSASELKAFR
ncbi:MAG: hypothetical protein AAFR23_08610, partial [Pseudomonadota bacterium]